VQDSSSNEKLRAFEGMNPHLTDQDNILTFDSNFESGNLDMAFKVNDYEYDLYMRLDTNTKGIQQWFYFSCEHGPALENKTIRFNVNNFTK
jgi:hypothetical protein